MTFGVAGAAFATGPLCAVVVGGAGVVGGRAGAVTASPAAIEVKGADGTDCGWAAMPSAPSTTFAGKGVDTAAAAEGTGAAWGRADRAIAFFGLGADSAGPKPGAPASAEGSVAAAAGIGAGIATVIKAAAGEAAFAGDAASPFLACFDVPAESFPIPFGSPWIGAAWVLAFVPVVASVPCKAVCNC